MRSSIWRSIAWPDPRESRFANAVITVKTQLPPLELLNELHAAELFFGRERLRPNAPRTLDLDLLAYGQEIRTGSDGLILPHPRLHQREFVLRPLAEIYPDWQHPVTRQRTRELLAALGQVDSCQLWSAKDSEIQTQPASCLCQEDFL